MVIDVHRPTKIQPKKAKRVQSHNKKAEDKEGLQQQLKMVITCKYVCKKKKNYNNKNSVVQGDLLKVCTT